MESPLSTSPTPSFLSSRSQPRSLRSIVSSEPLTAHPLLASPPPSSTPAPLSTTLSAAPDALAPSYPVYSGRHKRYSTTPSTPTTSSAAAEPALHSPTATPKPAAFLPPLVSRASNSTLPHPPSPPTRAATSRNVSEATAKLLSQRIKSDVQGLGLGGDSLGAAVVAKLGSVSTTGEWKIVMDLVGKSTEQITLLLSAERASSNLTPGMVLDHLVKFQDGVDDDGTPRAFTTLSGLRGWWSPQESSLRFVSYFASTSSTTSRSIPLPYPATTAATHYPSISILPQSTTPTSLSVPRTNTSVAPAAVQRSSSRLTSLFGSRPDDKSKDKSKDKDQVKIEDQDAGLPPIVPAPAGWLGLDTTSSTSSSSSSSSTDNLTLSVLPISSTLHRPSVIRAIDKATEQHLRAASIDESVAEKCADFVAKVRRGTEGSATLAAGGGVDREVLAERWQSLVSALWLDLSRAVLGSSTSSSGGGGGSAQGATLSVDMAESNDLAIEEALEVVEANVLSLLYEVVWDSEDDGEDRALETRVETVRDGGLGLRSLGLDLDLVQEDQGWPEGALANAVEDIVSAARDELAKLADKDCRTPKAKVTILVNVHKVLVEGLSGLPPIPLKEPAPPPTVNEAGDVEMDDASSMISKHSRSSSPSRSRRESRSASPNKADHDVEPDRTPKPKHEGSNPLEQSIPELELTSSVLDAANSSVFDTSSSITSTRSHSPSTSSADLILPLLIYVLVQSPSNKTTRLLSNLEYIQRFRAQSLMKGEAAYCVTNLLAASCFLTDTPLTELGLSPSAIPSSSSSAASSNRQRSPSKSSSKLRSQLQTAVTPKLDHFVDAANSTIVNVVDSSYRMLFGPRGFAPKTLEDVKNVLDGAGSVVAGGMGGLKGRGTLGRRQTSPAGFLIPQTGKELVDVVGAKEGEAKDFEAGKEKEKEKEKEPEEGRPSIHERLANIPGLAKSSNALAVPSSQGPVSRRATINVSPFAAAVTPHLDPVPSGSFPSPSPPSIVPPPLPPRTSSKDSIKKRPFRPEVTEIVQRFVDCEDAGELRVGEVALLLAEYKRLAEEVQLFRMERS